MLLALLLGVGLLGDAESARAAGVKPLGTAGGAFTIPRLSWPPASSGTASFFKKAPTSAPSPKVRPSPPPVHCTIRTLQADPQVDPHMAQTWEPEVDPRMVVKSRCAN
jgi:hypothetical protein